MVVCTDGRASLDHLGHATPGRAMDALESPSEEGYPIRGSVACGKGKVPKEIKGGGANAPFNSNAEWKESATLNSGNGQPFGVFCLVPSSFAAPGVWVQLIQSLASVGSFVRQSMTMARPFRDLNG